LQNAAQAIAVDATDPASHLAIAWALLIDDKPHDAIAALDRASALAPEVPSEYDYLRGVSLLVADDFETAAAVLRKAADRNPSAAMLFVPLSVALVRLGRREEARQSLLAYFPDTDQAGLEAIVGNKNDALFPFKMVPKFDFLRERLYDAVRVAALPLDVTPITLEADLDSDNPFQKGRHPTPWVVRPTVGRGRAGSGGGAQRRFRPNRCHRDARQDRPGRRGCSSRARGVGK